MLTICLISDSKKATPAQLRMLAIPLEENLRHAWEHWRNYLPHWMADAPPMVVQWDDKPLPVWGDVGAGELGRAVPMYFVDSLSRNPDTLAVHYVQANRPAARVYVEASTGLNNGRASLIELAGHEGVELECNPWLELWEAAPGRPNLLTPREPCDAVQDTYDSMSADPSGRPWQLANFVTPAWFGLPSSAKGVHGPLLDYADRRKEPGEIGPEGYLIVRDDDWHVRYEFGSAYAGERMAGRIGKPEGRSREVVRRCTLQQRARLSAEDA